MTTKISSKKNERGNTLVEASLILVLALSLLIGLFDLLQIMFIHQTVVDRTRAVARWAAVNPYDATKTTNMVLYASTTAPTDGSAGLFNMTSLNVAVSHDTSDGLYADRIGIVVSGYSYSFFAAALVNNMYPTSGQSGTQSSTRTGLTV